MKRLRITRSLSVVRDRVAKLAAVAAALVALGAVAAVPADARHDPRADGGAGAREHPPGGDGPITSAVADVNFRRNALFTCFGANGGAATQNTANITATLTTVRAVVTVHAPAGTTVNGQLTQSGCARLKFFTFRIPAGGVATVTITDLRISRDAFVWFNDTAGDFQITPEVIFQ
jgi:hypothetical protein